MSVRVRGRGVWGRVDAAWAHTYKRAMKQRWWLVVALLAWVSCSSSRGRATPSAAAAAAGPAASLDHLLLDIPCPRADAPTECDVVESVRKRSKTVRMGGDSNRTYAVKLHFCGPAEGRRYTACVAGGSNPLLCVDGKTASENPDDPSYPTYELKVAAPAHSYFLNGQPLYDDIMKIDYSVTVPIQGGSSVTLGTDGGSNAGIYTSKLNGRNFTCADVPGIQQPFVGQFIYMTVDGVEPAL
jgi:hypothetical protein